MGIDQLYFQNWKYSMATCISFGLAKEIYDEIDYGGFSTSDLLQDGIGCSVGVLASYYIWPDGIDNKNKIHFSIGGDTTTLQYKYLF